MAVDPVVAARDDLLAGDLAVRGGVPAAGGGGLAVGVCDAAAGAGLDVVVGDVAAVCCFVPDVGAVDGLAGGLAGELDVVAFFVGLDDAVAGCGARAAVDGATADGVGGDERGEEGEREGEE